MTQDDLHDASVQIAAAEDALGQQYVTPQQAIEHGSDIIIVGRGILNSREPLATAKQYRETSWSLI